MFEDDEIKDIEKNIGQRRYVDIRQGYGSFAFLYLDVLLEWIDKTKGITQLFVVTT